MIQTQADAPIPVPCLRRRSWQKANTDLSSTVDGRANDHPFTACGGLAVPCLLGPSQSASHSETQPAEQSQIDMGQCRNLSADVLRRSRAGGDQGKTPTGLVSVRSPIAPGLAGPRQRCAVGMTADQPSNDGAVWHQKPCADAGCPLPCGLCLHGLTIQPSMGQEQPEEHSQNQSAAYLMGPSCHKPKGAA